MSVELEFDYQEKSAAMETFSQKDIDELHSWIQSLDKSKYVPKDLSNKQLLLFYNACYQDINKTKTCIEKYYVIRHSAPEFFDNRIISSADLKPSVDALEFFYLPQRSVEGYDIIYHRLHETEPSKYFFEAGVKLLAMTVDACLHKHGPSPGYIFLFDMRGVRFGHILRLNLGAMKKFFDYIQKGLPVRMKSIHVLNTEPIIDKILAIIRPFMDKSLFELINLHNKNEDLEAFYRDTIPREALPPDYGGSLPDTQVLHTKCMNQLEALADYFKTEEEQRKAAVAEQHKGKKKEKVFNGLEID